MNSNTTMRQRVGRVNLSADQVKSASAIFRMAHVPAGSVIFPSEAAAFAGIIRSRCGNCSGGTT